MSRKPRIISSTGIYHITLRSVNQHIIFEEDADYLKFLFILSECKRNYDIDIYAYCLMNNHIHLLLYSSPNDLSSFFQSLGSRFVRWYNYKYLRSGHLFQERFHSVAITSSAQYLSTLMYIHNNPIKASMCRFPSEYRWSSFNDFYGRKNPLVNVSYSYNIAGSKESLLHYFATYNDDSCKLLPSESNLSSKHFISDEKALVIFKSITHLNSTAEVYNLAKASRNNYIKMLRNVGLTQKQVARIMDISIATVKRICQDEPFST